MRSAPRPRKLIGRQGDDGVFYLIGMQGAVFERLQHLFRMKDLVARLPALFLAANFCPLKTFLT